MIIEFQWPFIGCCNTLLWHIFPMENGQKLLSLTIEGENVGIDLRPNGLNRKEIKKEWLSLRKGRGNEPTYVPLDPNLRTLIGVTLTNKSFWFTVASAHKNRWGSSRHLRETHSHTIYSWSPRPKTLPIWGSAARREHHLQALPLFQGSATSARRDAATFSEHLHRSYIKPASSRHGTSHRLHQWLLQLVARPLNHLSD